MRINDQILIGGAILLLAVASAVGTRRLRFPLLVTFLGLGMLLGSEASTSTTRSSRDRSGSSG